MNIKGIAINADAGFIDGNLTLLERELDYYEYIGYTHVELAVHGVGAIYCGKLDSERVREVQTILKRKKLRYAVHGPNPLNLMNMQPDAIDRQGLIASIEFASAVESDILVYHAGRYLPEEAFLMIPQPYPTAGEKDVMWKQEQEMLCDVAETAARHGVTIGVENARPYLNAPRYCYGESLEKLAGMVKQVCHPNIGITLDMGHAYLAAKHYGYDLGEGIGAVAPFVRHIHLHDNFGRCCTSYERKQYEMTAMGRGDMHMPIGMGEVPARQMFSRLPGYSGLVTLELRPRYRSKYAEALQAARSLLMPSERCAS
jgi:sugar phosphate isomerase/epimerase